MCDGKRRLEGNVGLRVWQLEGGLVFQLLSLGDQDFFFSFPGILVILEPPKIKSDTVYSVSPSISHEVMRPDAMILVF